jgi:hypothetical protein
MTLSSEPCHGRRLRGCSLETRSAWPLWLKHGRSREFVLVANSIFKTVTVASLSVLGWVPGIITMVVAGILFWITSITMHKFIMKHPQIKDICRPTLTTLYGSFLQLKASPMLINL